MIELFIDRRPLRVAVGTSVAAAQIGRAHV